MWYGTSITQGAAASRPLLVPTAGLLPSFSAPWRHRPPFLLALGPAELFIDILAAGRLRTLSDLAQFLDGGDGDGGAVGRLSPAQLRAAAKPLDLRAVCLQLVRESEASSASVGRLAHAQFRGQPTGKGTPYEVSASGAVGSELRWCPPRIPQYRIAMVIPWVGALPVWSSYFFASAAAASPLVDFLVFHEG